ncbi:helix-turn-helix domain-containing protein [Salinicoccus carnicancri]|uniref:helix-turn-helix domain-containing protein n=1 Tax=Salinicoccus carnicancri TaxID=558170 RepID=UPI00031BA03E|nr:helix-turn-helix transcriptional regulator [Salinicoccus carnicancri]
MALGERIRNLRKSKNMTLADLAGDEITKGMMSLIENGRSKPSMETLQYIAGTLDVSVSHLMQEGDDEWTESVLEYEGFTDTFNFPYAFIEEEVLTNLDKVAQNSRGMEVYNILRVYYRMKGKHEIADEYTAKINEFYKSVGMEHLAVRNKLDDAVSFMYSRDYQEAYSRMFDIEADVLEFKAYDSRIELDHLYHKSILAASVDREAHVRVGNEAINLSYELENFKYFDSLNIILGIYYQYTGDVENSETCQENLRKYLAFNTKKADWIDFVDPENPIMYYRVLTDDSNARAALYESYLARVDSFLEGHTVKNASAKYYRNIFELELTYFQGKYKEVVDGYRDDMHIRPLAQHPIDRIIMAVRSSIYPLSLHQLGRTEDARAEFGKIEETIEDISDSVFTKEFYMIKDIIFGE